MLLPAPRRVIAAMTAALLAVVGIAGAATGAADSAVLDVERAAVASEGNQTETLVEESALPVDPVGVVEPGVLDAATESAAVVEADHPETPTDIVIADSPRSSSAEAVVVGLTEPIEVPAEQVSAMGVTWLGAVDGVQVDVRARAGDDWGEWLTLDLEGASDDAEEGGAERRQGTSPYLVTGDAVVQARVLTADGSRPDDLQLSLVGVGTSPVPLLDDSTVVSQTASGGELTVTDALYREPEGATAIPTALMAAAGPITAPRPAIRLRSEWGARAFIGEPEIRSVQGAVIHHTVTANDYAQSQVPAILRSIQAYHMNGRDWSDIGYNFLVDRFGTIWEGRQGGVTLPIRGVHASEANSVSTGISVIGRHDVAAVPTATRYSVTRLVAWKLAIHGVPVGSTITLNGVRMTNVIGHRNVPTAQTACPGTYLYALLPAIRAGAASLQSFEPVRNIRAITALDAVDVLVTGADTGLVTIDDEPVGAGTRIGNGWLAMDMVTIGPALLGGSTRDMIAREAATGRLWIYHGNGAGSFRGRTALGFGWGAMEHVLSPGDFDGDGRGDLIAIEAGTGRMWFYPGNGALKFGPRRQIGNGWQEVQAAATTSDITGDGIPDVVGILDNGQVKVYAGSGRGTFRSTTLVGTVTAPVDALLVPGDLTFDGRADIVMRDTAGDRMIMLPARGPLKFGAPTAWGGGGDWGDMHTMLSGAGWRGVSGRSILGIDNEGYFYEYPAKSTVTLSSRVSSLDTATPSDVVVVGDVVGDGLADVVTKGEDGFLWLHEATSGGSFAAPVLIGSGWTNFTQLVGIGDLDFDGAPELLAKHRDGRVFVYPFHPARDGRFLPQYQVGNGFGGYTLVSSPDWDTNGGSTVFAINDATGALRAFFARTGTTLLGGATIGSGWHSFSDVVAVSNPVSTGQPALLARRPAGTYLYLGDGHGGFGRRVGVQTISVPTGEELR